MSSWSRRGGPLPSEPTQGGDEDGGEEGDGEVIGMGMGVKLGLVMLVAMRMERGWEWG